MKIEETSFMDGPLSNCCVYLNININFSSVDETSNEIIFWLKSKTSKNDSNTFRKAFSETIKIAKNCKPAQHTSISRCC